MENDFKVIYKIYVSTTDIPNAGTNANVFIQLYGKIKSKRSKETQLTSLKFPLEKSEKNLKKFQPGQTDLFEIEDVYIGKLKKIRINHDGKKVNSGWHLNNVVIKIDEVRKKYTFECKKWLDPFELDGKVTRDLKPMKHNNFDESDSEESATDENKNEKQNEKKNKKSPKIRYDIKIETSEYSKIDSGTQIDLKIFGKEGTTDLIKLNSTPSDSEKDKFLSSNLDIFRLEAADIGVVCINFCL